jgi:hypothetical protein
VRIGVGEDICELTCENPPAKFSHSPNFKLGFGPGEIALTLGRSDKHTLRIAGAKYSPTISERP